MSHPRLWWQWTYYWKLRITSKVRGSLLTWRVDKPRPPHPCHPLLPTAPPLTLVIFSYYLLSSVSPVTTDTHIFIPLFFPHYFFSVEISPGSVVQFCPRSVAVQFCPGSVVHFCPGSVAMFRLCICSTFLSWFCRPFRFCRPLRFCSQFRSWLCSPVQDLVPWSSSGSGLWFPDSLPLSLSLYLPVCLAVLLLINHCGPSWLPTQLNWSMSASVFSCSALSLLCSHTLQTLQPVYTALLLMFFDYRSGLGYVLILSKYQSCSPQTSLYSETEPLRCLILWFHNKRVIQSHSKPRLPATPHNLVLPEICSICIGSLRNKGRLRASSPLIGWLLHSREKSERWDSKPQMHLLVDLQINHKRSVKYGMF